MNQYLTLEQADALLPQLTERLQNARRLKRSIEMVAASCDYDATLLELEREKVKQLVGELQQEVDALEDLGAYVTDVDVGILDFLSKFEGRDVFLCWKLGEPKIAHWHELQEGFSARQQIVRLEGDDELSHL